MMPTLYLIRNRRNALHVGLLLTLGILLQSVGPSNAGALPSIGSFNLKRNIEIPKQQQCLGNLTKKNGNCYISKINRGGASASAAASTASSTGGEYIASESLKQMGFVGA